MIAVIVAGYPVAAKSTTADEERRNDELQKK
jgi:hypothetical protein